MRIDVTENKIATGNRKNGFSCPVALALIEAGVTKPNVYGYLITYEISDGIRRSWEPPTSVKEFTKAFDNGQPVEPFSFEWEQ